MSHRPTPLLACALAGLSAGALHGGAPDGLAKRGAYLVRVMDCATCHTPMKLGPNGPEPDQSLAFSGHPASLKMPPGPDMGRSLWVWAGSGTNTAFAGPWGTSFTANLTPDKETGLGAWTERTFIAAMRTGRHMGKGRPILPPMPYRAFGTATDADLKAIFAYLRTLKPISNHVPDPVDPPQAPQP